MAQTKKQTDNDGYAAEPDKLAGMGQMTDGGRRTDDQNSDGDRDTNNNSEKDMIGYTRHGPNKHDRKETGRTQISQWPDSRINNGDEGTGRPERHPE